jgi:hypothetical protein
MRFVGGNLGMLNLVTVSGDAAGGLCLRNTEAALNRETISIDKGLSGSDLKYAVLTIDRKGVLLHR